MLASQRSAGIGHMVQHRAKAVRRHDLEAFQRIACPFLAMQQQLARMLEGREARPDYPPAADFGEQPQGCGGHDAKRALGTDQQLLEIESAIVLLERRERVEHAAVGHHRLQSEHLRTHRAVAQHLCAAGIRRDKAADGCRSLAAKGQGKAQAVFFRQLVQVLQDEPGLACHLHGVGIDFAHRVHPAQREQDGPAGGIGGGSTGHAAVPALRHDGHRVARAQLHESGHLARRGGRGKAQRLACKPPAPVGQPRLEQFGVARKAARPEQRGGFVEKSVIRIHRSRHATRGHGKATTCHRSAFN